MCQEDSFQAYSLLGNSSAMITLPLGEFFSFQERYYVLFCVIKIKQVMQLLKLLKIKESLMS